MQLTWEFWKKLQHFLLQNMVLTGLSFWNYVRELSTPYELGIFCSLRIWWYWLFFGCFYSFQTIHCNSFVKSRCFSHLCFVSSNCIRCLTLCLGLRNWSSRIYLLRKLMYLNRISWLTYFRFGTCCYFMSGGWVWTCMEWNK